MAQNSVLSTGVKMIKFMTEIYDGMKTFMGGMKVTGGYLSDSNFKEKVGPSEVMRAVLKNALSRSEIHDLGDPNKVAQLVDLR